MNQETPLIEKPVVVPPPPEPITNDDTDDAPPISAFVKKGNPSFGSPIKE